MKAGSLVKYSHHNLMGKWADTSVLRPVFIILIEEQVENLLWTALFPSGQVFQVSPQHCEVINESR